MPHGPRLALATIVYYAQTKRKFMNREHVKCTATAENESHNLPVRLLLDLSAFRRVEPGQVNQPEHLCAQACDLLGKVSARKGCLWLLSLNEDAHCKRAVCML